LLVSTAAGGESEPTFKLILEGKRPIAVNLQERACRGRQTEPAKQVPAPGRWCSEKRDRRGRLSKS